jgi:glycosyltransferase involved in cell wall biosynthesis
MKILMVSMLSNHFFNWVKQLEGSGHEIYWIDVYDSDTKVEKINFVHQITGWRNRYDYPGRYRLKANFKSGYDFLAFFNQRSLSSVFESLLREIQPDLVHSFVMYSACAPLLGVMQKYPKVKWAYSAWGNDLFYYQNEQKRLSEIKKTLPKLNYMFADCYRDFMIAEQNGFKGKYLGTFPTGGGYDFSFYDKHLKPFKKRNVILIKGYEHKFGRCNRVLKAISTIKNNLEGFEIVVFGANQRVLKHVEKHKLDAWKNVKIYEQLSHQEVLKLMGLAYIYIGNSISDGMPNTLLEAIIMGAFPIQSNPGGATEEHIIHGKNGFLITNPESPDEIALHITQALKNPDLLESAVLFNNQNIRPKLERETVKKKVLEQYRLMEKEIKQ